MSGDWRAIYQARTMSADAALAAIRSGSRVFLSAGCGRPEKLIEALVNLSGKIADIELIHMVTLGIAPYTSAKYENRFRYNALFIGSEVSTAVAEGRADFTPTNKFQMAQLLRNRHIPLDVALIQVSPPDDQGNVSMGITVGISKVAAECARHVVAEVNPNMPRTCGNSLLHVSQIDAFVPSRRQLPEAPEPEADPLSDEIARHCSRLIYDGATIHLGYTPVAFALPKHLGERRDLGVHTDILTAPIVELIRRGIVTNAKKKINPHKTVTSLCYGTKEIYDFVADNPDIEFHSCDYVNDAFVISQHERMIAINEAFKVDLSGLVCAKFIGPRFGDGFMHGAGYAKRGRSIVTIPSTTANGEESNIVMHIEPTLGIAMSTNRDDVHYVVTEYGIATLRGRSIRERALALIHIAHPKFREELMKAAKAHRFVYADQLLALDAIYPDHVESQLTLKDDTRLLFRPAIPTDERMVQSFLYGMDARGIRYRFHGKLETVHHNRVQHFVNVDYTGTVTILGIREGDHGKEVIAIGQYLMYPEIEKAEVAFITAEDFRNRGIGTHLLKLLIGMAREKSIKAFFAEVLRQNHGMLKVFRKGGVPVEMTCEDGVHHVTLDLTADRDRRAKPAKQVPPQPSTGTDEKQESGGAEGRGTTLS